MYTQNVKCYKISSVGKKIYLILTLNILLSEPPGEHSKLRMLTLLSRTGFCQRGKVPQVIKLNSVALFPYSSRNVSVSCVKDAQVRKNRLRY